MDFAFSDEQQMLRQAARDWLAQRFPLERVAAQADAGAGDAGAGHAGAGDAGAAVWAELVELGWLDSSLDAVDTAVLFEESGAALLPAPLFSTVALGLPGADRTVPSTLAWAERGTDPVGAPAQVRSHGGRLTGTKVCVPDVESVRLVNVVAEDGIYAVAPDGPGVQVRPRSTLDTTRRLSDVVLDSAPAQRVADLEVLAGLRRAALAAAACEAVGIAARMLAAAAAHASSREQFGRVIGTYQAVSHRIADTYVGVELARSLAYWAAWSVAAADPDAEVACAAAKAAAGRTALAACESAIQVHGGIGFTWEAGLHRFYKRAQWLEGFGGGGAAARATVASAVLAAAGG